MNDATPRHRRDHRPAGGDPRWRTDCAWHPTAAARSARRRAVNGRFLGSRDPALGDDACAAFLDRRCRCRRAGALGCPRAGTASADDVRGLLDRDIVAIDAMLSEQLDAVLHHDRSAPAGRHLARPRLAGRRHGQRRPAEDQDPQHQPGRRSAATWNVPVEFDQSQSVPQDLRGRVRHRPAASHTA